VTALFKKKQKKQPASSAHQRYSFICCFIRFYFSNLFFRHTIVVKPKEDSIVLHGARNMTTFEESWPEPIAEKNGWKSIQRHPWNTIEEVHRACRLSDPTAHGKERNLSFSLSVPKRDNRAQR